MKKYTILIGILLISVLMVLSACGGSDSTASNNAESSEEQIKISIGHLAPPSHSVGMAADAIKKELEEKSEGRISVTVYPQGELGNEDDMFVQLNDGALDLLLVGTSSLSSRSEAFGAWLMPFLANSHEKAYELAISEEAMSLYDTLVNDNVKGLGYITSGYRWFLTTKPVETLKDLENMTLRTTPSPTILDFFNSVGVSPTPVPLPDVYSALQTGVIDGIDIDSESIRTINLHEIAKHLTPTGHMNWVMGVVMNNDKWSSLSEEDKKLMQEVVQNESKESFDLVTVNEKDILASLPTEHEVIIHDFDISELDPIVKKVRDDWSAKSEYIGKFLEKANEINQQ
ncbi:TRAP transporter substrate-binding protein [Bacillus sp. B15-48]|uniref:TRAP transporter substrate-binding protein n=1 Tax=Bacillus sp. B15-48 TaxID=1548601 RepID=UPI00193EF534|nr:TRAP transporter substrate-binding protein [Bacillus sp. B15-48]MBM4764697.1 hypothetical protein [Bacillus sp. B15-48]